jgi:hypothetical protein
MAAPLPETRDQQAIHSGLNPGSRHGSGGTAAQSAVRFDRRLALTSSALVVASAESTGIGQSRRLAALLHSPATRWLPANARPSGIP